MASPHQGSLAPNRSAFNFTQKGPTVGQWTESHHVEWWNGVLSHGLRWITYTTCSPRASENSNHLSHDQSSKQQQQNHVLYQGVCTSVVSTHACIHTHTNICVRAVLENNQKTTGKRRQNNNKSASHSFLSQASSQHCPWEKETYRNYSKNWKANITQNPSHKKRSAYIIM